MYIILKYLIITNKHKPNNQKYLYSYITFCIIIII